jgi:hypothetical protein
VGNGLQYIMNFGKFKGPKKSCKLQENVNYGNIKTRVLLYLQLQEMWAKIENYSMANLSTLMYHAVKVYGESIHTFLILAQDGGHVYS